MSHGLHACTSGIKQPAHVLHGGQAAGNHVFERSFPAKQDVRVGKLNPFICQFLAVQDIDRLEDAEQLRDSEHLVNVQDLIS
jgi:hypothetical protein